MKAIEARGTVDGDGRLIVKKRIPLPASASVRVIVLAPDGDDEPDALREMDGLDEPDERAWLRAAASGGAFDFLEDPAEDIYASTDGKPFHDDA